MSTFDDNRATAIIKRAQEGEMYAEGAMPESETDRVVVAEQLVEQARQVEQVRQMWIDQGKGQIELEQLIPHWPVAESILFEAHVTIGSSNGQPEHNPSQRTVMDAGSAMLVHEIVNGYARITDALGGHESWILESTLPKDGEEIDWSKASDIAGENALQLPSAAPLQADGDWSLSQQQEGGDADVQAAPNAARTDAIEPQSVVETGAVTREEPKADEVWADEHGQQWQIVSYSGGPMVIVRHPTTGEKTEAPAGFLKVKVPQTIEDVAKDVVPTAKSNQDPLVEEPMTYQPISKAAGPDFPDEENPSGSQASVPDTSIPEPDDEDDEEYRKILEETAARYMPEGFPVPHQLEHPPEFISIENLVDLDDLPARTKHSEFNALAARAKLLFSVEDARARDCARARKLSLRGPMREAREALGSSSTLTERESWSEENYPEVSTWAERAHKHLEDAKGYKIYFDMYSENVSVLSRDWTMRDKDRQS